MTNSSFDSQRGAEVALPLSMTSDEPLATADQQSERENIPRPATRSNMPLAGPRIGFFYRTGFLLTSTVAGLSSVCIKQLLLPLQVGVLDPHSTNTSFALVSAIGALAGLLAAPLTGALADRTTSRWGRRRPWLVAGISVGVIGLLVVKYPVI